MNYLTISALWGAIFAAAMAASAQTRTPANSPTAPRPQAPAQTTQRPDPELDDDVKIVGCLKLWDASIGAVPGEAATGPRYLLINAKVDESPGKDVVVVRRYIITAAPSVNLAGFVDRTVRISGDVAALPVLNLPAPGELPQSNAPARTGDSAVRPVETARPAEVPPPVAAKPDDDPTWLSLSASSVTTVAASCPASAR